MSTNWVKIAKDNRNEFRIRFGVVFQYLFNHCFGLSIRISRYSAVFLYTYLLSIAIYTGAARENNFVAFVLLHDFQQVDGPCKIIIIVFEGLVN